MKNVAKFEKVSYEQFEKDCKDAFPHITNERINEIYKNIKLPERENGRTSCYDFIIPFELVLEHNETIIVPTGIRVKIDNCWVLRIYPKRRLGFSYRIQLDETVSIVDEDYYYKDNEGHILLRITNDTKEYKILSLLEGDVFAQGIFSEYGITYDDIKSLKN